MTALLLLALQDVDSLIRDLGADAVERRDAASRELSRLRPLDKLRAAWSKTEDAEVRSRLAALLRDFDPWFETRKLATLDKNAVGWAIVGGHAVWWTRQRACYDEVSSRSYAVLDTIVLSPDGRRCAYRVDDDSPGGFVVVDGAEGPAFETVSAPLFSADGASVAYSTRTSVVIDGVKGPAFDEVWSLRFAPAGRKLAYLAREADKKFVVWHGKRGEPFTAVNALAFSADGSTLAYSARREKTAVVVVNDKIGPDFDWIDFTPVLSRDGSRVAYAARKGASTRFMVVDGVKGEDFDDVGLPFIGPDGTVAYQAKSKGRGYVVVADKRSADFDDAGWPYFSPDGKTVAFAASRGGKSLLVVGDKLWLEQDRLGTPVWSPDSKRIAVTAEVKDGWVVVCDEKPSDTFNALQQPVFGAGGTLAYVGRRDDGVHVVIGETVAKHTDARSIVFSPDGAHAAYAAFDGKAWTLVCDSKSSDRFDELRDILWSPDSRRVACGARRGLELWWIVLEVP